mmetsp:Transcript_14729/g.23820  ORF Transcript_14729/g.23820 Transcript_14729/m.23820 type:complete len:162 (+) Transcript_14729:218-703(+)
MPPQEDDDISSSALRLIYMDEEELLSPKNNSFHDSMNLSMSSIDWNQRHPPMSPTLDHHSDNHSDSSDHHDVVRSATGKRKSIRKSLSHALVTPVRAAKDKISLSSPKKINKSLKNALSHHSGHKSSSHNNWQKKLDLPKNVRQDEAIALLLSKELTMLDL